MTSHGIDPQVEEEETAEPRVPTPGHYRTVTIPRSMFDRWLNLPEGFRVDAVSDSMERDGIQIRIMCPGEEEYRVVEGAVLYELRPYEKEVSPGHGVIFWPEFGQEEPSEEMLLTEAATKVTDMILSSALQGQIKVHNGSSDTV